MLFSLYPLNEFYYYAGIIWIILILIITVGSLLWPKYYIGAITASVCVLFTLIGFLTPYGYNYFWRMFGLSSDRLKIVLISVLTIFTILYLVGARVKKSPSLLVQGVCYIFLILILLVCLSTEEARSMALFIVFLIILVIFILSPPPIPGIGIGISIAYFVVMIVVGKPVDEYPFSEIWFQMWFVAIFISCIIIRLTLIFVRYYASLSVLYIPCYTLPLFMLVMWIWGMNVAIFSCVIIGLCTVLILISVKYNFIDSILVFGKKGDVQKDVSKISDREKISRISILVSRLRIASKFLHRPPDNRSSEMPSDEEPSKIDSPPKIKPKLKRIVIPEIMHTRLFIGLILILPTVMIYMLLTDILNIFPPYISLSKIPVIIAHHPELLLYTMLWVIIINVVIYILFCGIYVGVSILRTHNKYYQEK